MGSTSLHPADFIGLQRQTTGVLSGALDADEPNAVFKNYLNRCLGEMGYEVIGWQ